MAFVSILFLWGSFRLINHKYATGCTRMLSELPIHYKLS
jgi:hypothetical protein